MKASSENEKKDQDPNYITNPTRNPLTLAFNYLSQQQNISVSKSDLEVLQFKSETPWSQKKPIFKYIQEASIALIIYLDLLTKYTTFFAL